MKLLAPDRRPPAQRGARRRHGHGDRGAGPARAELEARAAVGPRRPRPPRHLRLSPGPARPSLGRPICGPRAGTGTRTGPCAGRPDRPVRPESASGARDPPCGADLGIRALSGVYWTTGRFPASGVDRRYVCRPEEDGSWLTRCPPVPPQQPAPTPATDAPTTPTRRPEHPRRRGRRGRRRAGPDRRGPRGRGGQVRRLRDPGARGARGGPQAPRHVHRLHRRARPAPPGLGGRRQLRRRVAGRPLRPDRGHPPRRRRRPGRGQRPRHPHRHAPGRGHPGGDHGADHAARGRQVRRRRLQGLRRSARRRRLGGQRAEPARCRSTSATAATTGGRPSPR